MLTQRPNTHEAIAVPAAPTALPALATTAVPVVPSPAAPTDCSVATTPPAAVGARVDIMDAAVDPAAIPATPNPIILIAAGMPTTATTALPAQQFRK